MANLIQPHAKHRGGPNSLLACVALVCLFLGGCDQLAGGSPTYTLHRNSPLDRSMRVHWATFDVSDSQSDFNRNQCEMAARLLNANTEASARAEGKEPHPDVGFWCEEGSYAEEGLVPMHFEAEYPTDVRSPMRF